jgi:TfoX/Sxy family transcriptional regulator of competence genes
MAVDEALWERLRAQLSEVDGIAERPMVGGSGFMLHGNLVCGVMGEDLLVRVGRKDFDRFVTEHGARPMAMGGRSSRSWILVAGAVVSDEAELARWVDRAIAFASTLPAK